MTKKDLETIVSAYGYLIDRAYSPEFCWEADVGNMVAPLEFAHLVRLSSGPDGDLIADLEACIDAHVEFVFNTFPMAGREPLDLAADIARNIAQVAQDKLDELKDEIG